MKKIYLGTPHNSALILEKLIEKNIIFDAVVTSPDKPFGRKKVLISSPVKNIALKYGIDVVCPNSKDELDEVVKKLNPDYAVVVAYGIIIKKSTLDSVPLGFYNLHFSLLPLYRGADPVRWAIINGEKETGISVFKIDEGIDTGPVVLQKKVNIGDDERYHELLQKLSLYGVELIYDAVMKIEKGDLKLFPQTGASSYAPKITVHDTYIDFNRDISWVYNRIRAFSVDPYARFTFNHRNRKTLIQIISASAVYEDFESFKCGEICGFEKGKSVFVKCLKGVIKLNTIKPEGKKAMNAYDYFINGCGLKKGDIIYG